MKQTIESIDDEIKKKNLDKVFYTTVKEKIDTKYNLSWKKVIKPPPFNSSLETLSDLNYLSRITNSRSEEQKNLLLLVDKDPKKLFIEVLDKYSLKFPQEEFKKYYDIIEPYIRETKQYFNRARPYQISKLLNKNINVLETKTHHTASYPSGHTCYAKLCEILCVEKYPNLGFEFEQLVNLTAYCRELQGVHYRSDNEASIILTSFWFEELQKIV